MRDIAIGAAGRMPFADDAPRPRPLARLFDALGLRIADAAGFAALALAVGAICVNALMLQTGKHPAPLGPPQRSPASALLAPRLDVTGSVPLPVPRPAELAPVPAAVVAPAEAQPAPPKRPRAQVTADLQRELARRGFYDGPADGVFGAKTDAAIRDVEQSLGWRETGEPTEALLAAVRRLDPRAVPRPPAPVPVDARLLAVQRALAKLGYGPIRPDGRPGVETREAIRRFERDRNLPVSGEIGDRVVRELAAVSGMPIE